MVSALFETAGEAVTGMAGLVGDGTSGIVSLFYNSSTGLTTVGILGLVGLGIGVFYFVFRWIRSLMKARG